MSYEELKEYLSYLKKKTGPLDVKIDWEVIRANKIKAYTPGKRMGLQIADAVAGSFYYALEPSAYGYTEDRYARMLKPVVYSRKGRFLGYGLKFWPREVNALIEKEEHFEWARAVYK
ncbi:MAG: hypothetical protein ACE5I2_15715 [Anaerolineae bacterium]